jgi:hypothetical protein
MLSSLYHPTKLVPIYIINLKSEINVQSSWLGPWQSSRWTSCFFSCQGLAHSLTCNIKHVLENFDWSNMIPISVTCLYLWCNESFKFSTKKRMLDHYKPLVVLPWSLVLSTVAQWPTLMCVRTWIISLGSGIIASLGHLAVFIRSLVASVCFLTSPSDPGHWYDLAEWVTQDTDMIWPSDPGHPFGKVDLGGQGTVEMDISKYYISKQL